MQAQVVGMVTKEDQTTPGIILGLHPNPSVLQHLRMVVVAFQQCQAVTGKDVPTPPWWERDQLQEFEGVGRTWRVMLGAAAKDMNTPAGSAPSPCCSPWAPHSPSPHWGDGRGTLKQLRAESPAHSSAQGIPP